MIHDFLRKNRILVSALGMIIASFVYCFGLVFVLDFGKFYTGGVTGIAQIFANIFDMPYLKSILTGVINIPLFIIGWKGVSKRFAILSLSSVILQVLFTALFDYMKIHGFNPFAGLAVYVTNPAGEQVLANAIVFAILGGAMTGFGCGFALRTGASTGGMDIVSQKFSLKTSIPFSYISGTIDAIIIIAGTIAAGDIAVGVYTIIRLFTHIVVLDKIYTIYKYQKITIVTKKRDEMQVALLKNFCHGVTIYQAVGGYTDEVKWSIDTIVLAYELEDYKKVIRETDPHAFISINDVKAVSGNYVKKVIIN